MLGAGGWELHALSRSAFSEPTCSTAIHKLDRSGEVDGDLGRRHGRTAGAVGRGNSRPLAVVVHRPTTTTQRAGLVRDLLGKP